MFALQVADAGVRLAASRLPPGRRQARPEARPGELHLQPDHRRHRPGRRHPDRRLEPAPRGGGAQCAHPRALARGRRQGWRDRRTGRPHLSRRLSRRRPGIPGAARGRRGRLRQGAAEAKRPLVIVGQGALARPDGDVVLSLAARRGRWRRRATKAGTALPSSTPLRRASAASTSASSPATAASTSSA